MINDKESASNFINNSLNYVNWAFSEFISVFQEVNTIFQYFIIIYKMLMEIYMKKYNLRLCTKLNCFHVQFKRHSFETYFYKIFLFT